LLPQFDFEGIQAMTVKQADASLSQPRATALLIYKVAGRQAWTEAERIGAFTGSPDDVRDGYIHFSTAQHLAGTLAKYYAGRDDLVFAAVDPARLGALLKWEAARGGALFPHLYGPLAMTDVAWVRPLPLDRDGRHRLPEGILPEGMI
jgi:uncharacterized protein (DUF952 family)